MIEAVIFDLDGSMVDSMWVWKSIDIEYLGRFGIRLPEDLQASIGGDGGLFQGALRDSRRAADH